MIHEAYSILLDLESLVLHEVNKIDDWREKMTR